MFDRIIVGTNCDETYIGFCDLQILAHRVFFPEVRLTFAFLVDDPQFPIDAMKELVEQNGADAYFYKPADGVTLANQAKLLRYYCASQFPDEVSIVCDIDTIPLNSAYIESLAERRVAGQLLAVGREVYSGTHDGKFPAHHTAGEGRLFEQLYNTVGKSFADVVRQHAGSRVHDHKEDVRNAANAFSDESLNRALIQQYDVPVQYVTRDIDIHTQWIDRAWWDKLDVAHLNADGYIEANLLRPYTKNEDKIAPIVEYLQCKLPPIKE